MSPSLLAAKRAMGKSVDRLGLVAQNRNQEPTPAQESVRNESTCQGKSKLENLPRWTIRFSPPRSLQKLKKLVKHPAIRRNSSMVVSLPIAIFEGN